MGDVEQRVGYVIRSGGRDTLGLLWACIVAICLCTWTVQRPNVVPRSAKTIGLLRKKAFWMCLTIIGPEYVAYVAIAQWLTARKFKQIQALGYPDFSIVHAFYVEMGGVVIQIKEENPDDKKGEAVIQTEEEVPDDNKGKVASERATDCQYTIYMDDLLVLLREQIMSVPNIPLEDLEERSKTDNFARFITFWHVLVFVINTVGRITSHLPISLLEVGTLAFVFCAVCIEFCWWTKPLDLRIRTMIELPPEQQQRFLDLERLHRLPQCPPEQTLAELGDYKLFWRRVIQKGNSGANLVHVAWIGCIFNGIHIFAWNASFPSQTEKLFWRVASIVACITIVGEWLALFLRHRKIVMLLTFGTLAPIYLIARMYLLTESFVSLRSVPTSMYDSPAWQNETPFI